MRVTLILLPNVELWSPFMVPPLGIMYVASSLREAGHQVSMVDLRETRIEDVDKRFFPKADWYGMGPSTTEFHSAVKVAKILKKTFPKSKLMIGGPHVTTCPQDCVNLFDAIIVGEGEKAVLDAVENNKNGIVEYEPIRDLDSISFPARDLLPYRSIFSDDVFSGEGYSGAKGQNGTTIISSRGCYWGKCAYCANPFWLKGRIRFRSVENVVQEVDELINKYDCYYYRWNDDNFTVNKKFVFDLCEELAKREVRWRCHTRSNLVTHEILEAMYQGGCREAAYGIETCDNVVLKLMQKGETVEDHTKAIQLTKEAGIIAKSYLMVGLPGETWETIEKVKMWMTKVKPDKWSLSTFQPFPGCDVWTNPEKYGVKILSHDFQNWWLYVNYSPIETNVASNREIVEHRKHLFNFLRKGEWRK